jgi:hypothetical protein
MASAAPAQTNMDDLLDEGKDLLIQQSLGSFGNSLGARVPVLIDHQAAYPTVSALPGNAFAPKPAPSIASALRASRDGTAPLPPGDYAFPVDVFCMRANAESPFGYQYRIAPLRGSAADIITALNARAPSYPIAHGVLQVLHWNIQAGVPYAGMAAPERAAVDKLIPEFRSRFAGTSYGSIATEYANVARSIPGMPALEQALQRIGPIGNAMSNLNTLQKQLAAHPQEYQQLSRVLVPLGAAAGSTTLSTAASRATPWSRYSDQVYARFVTSGNFTTPGTYEVRVLGGRAAPVPFSNIVADSGTDRVQSLTIAVRAPAPGSKPAPPPPPQPKIISNTLVSVPGIPNSRTTVGVAEPVALTFTGGQANWSLDSHSLNPVEKLDEGHLTFEHGSATTYVAATDKRTETVTAEGAHGTKATITFNVIAPTDLRQVVDPTNPLIHTFDLPNIGFWAQTYIQPENVSFQFVRVREGDVCATATGVYIPPDGILTGHQPAVSPTRIIAVVPGLGSLVYDHDQVYSGIPVNYPIPFGHPTYVPGVKNWHIPWFYSLPSGQREHRFAFADARFELEPDGSTLTASKAHASVTTTVLSDTVGKLNPESGSGPSDAKPLLCP